MQTRSLLLVAVVLVAGMNAANAQDKPTLQPPKGPAPHYGIASLDKRGNVLVQQTVQVPVNETRTRVIVVDGKKVEQNYVVTKFVTQVQTSLLTPDRITVSKASGTTVLAEDFEDVFGNPVPVLLTTNGQPLDPFYVKLLKPTTLIIVRKRLKPAAKN